MSLTLVTAPTTEPLTLQQAKNHLRLDHDEDDSLLRNLITTAKAYVEGQTHRALITQTWDYAIDYGWPYGAHGRSIRLPLNPVASITSISYVDSSGNSQTLAADQYTATTRQHGSFIVPAYDVSWPDVRCVPDAITVRFVAGEADCAPQLRQAVTILVTHLYENREAVRSRDIVPTPYALEALLSPYRSGLPQ